MKSTWYPYNFDFKSLFSDSRLEWIHGVERVYFAEKGNIYFLIYDGSGAYETAIALSNSEQEKQIIATETFIEIIEFTGSEARAKYRQENYPDDAMAKIYMKKYRYHQE